MTEDILKISMASICAPSEDVVAREIEGEMIIIPLVAGIGDAEDELYTLNEAGQAIWQALDGERTLGEVAVLLAQEYQSTNEELEVDVVGFVTEMVRRGMITHLSDSD